MNAIDTQSFELKFLGKRKAVSLSFTGPLKKRATQYLTHQNEAHNIHNGKSEEKKFFEELKLLMLRTKNLPYIPPPFLCANLLCNIIIEDPQLYPPKSISSAVQPSVNCDKISSGNCHVSQKQAEQLKHNKPLSDLSSLPYISLYRPTDDTMLSKCQVYLRRHIEVFEATEEDAEHSRGRNTPIMVGQVGIRCCFCRCVPVKNRSKGSVYFPSARIGIYQAAQNMNQYHFMRSCPNVPNSFSKQYNELLASSSSNLSNGGKDYWAEAAENVGIVETTLGLQFKGSHIIENIHENDEESNILLKHAENNESNLMNSKDRMLITDFVFLIFSQMTPYENQHRQEHNSRKCEAGLMCKHCMGSSKSGLFLPVTVMNISKNKKFTQILTHLLDCHQCPFEIKNTLKKLELTHPYQARTIKRGSKKEFFTQLIDRIKLSKQAQYPN